MPALAAATAAMFNEAYEKVGHYVTDTEMIPYYNPADSGVDILPSEPLLLLLGSDERAVLSQGVIRPGELGMVLMKYTVDLPAVISADVTVGTPIYWDFATKKAKIGGDVTNGWIVGYATFPVNQAADFAYPLDANDRVIAAASGSTWIRVYLDGAGAIAVTKGTVTSAIL